jgi:hypothetical protein
MDHELRPVLGDEGGGARRVRGVPARPAFPRADDGRDGVLPPEALSQGRAEEAVGAGQQDFQGFAMNG